LEPRTDFYSFNFALLLSGYCFGCGRRGVCDVAVEEIKSILAALGNHPVIERSLDFVSHDTPLPAFMNNISSYCLTLSIDLITEKISAVIGFLIYGTSVQPDRFFSYDSTYFFIFLIWAK